MSLTLRQVRYFVATAEIGQISQAAIHLNISQSAVTTAIKELEAMLGALLFQRSAQGMTLTEAGRHFLNRAYVILRSVDDALNSPLPDLRASGVLRLAASYTVLGYFLPHHLQRLEHWHPDVSLQVQEQERSTIEQGLLEGDFDMAVVLTANLTHPDIVSETLFNSERRLWLPSHHPLCERSSVSLADVAREPYIQLTVDEAEQATLRYWEQAGQRPRVRVRTSSVEAVRSMVANGSGVAILSDLVHRPWSLEGKRIETVTISDPVTPMSVGLAWHRERAFSPAMQAVRTYFHGAFLAPQQLSARR
ncbi:LysR family transcriptional regulator [Pseudomonas sp. SWI6]|uniref:LysR family transcriptional regulator n=1 Tax=Pseudomonas taiwanensis TaxID=470150 RepID=A0ABR6V408_9PSED|nr:MULTISPECIES: LysR family transcriptional regulator [Pseudomonas]AGZ34958.1 LysR family transcriptional regulator [Pseudomonas sp. VLB120]AVD83548.1 LysR family transcriptional regulator [Pseudomonas sp. SWI6]AVD85695.1 LysR family transcriptional regulator [Pseudomonas sp. SWI44]MBC3475241.1 LysR family transcriptional regulator [Pseudomonas taiwanensis]MBC3490147.1 LysR family transcriptional regulator [Pseudomonas taiwanensis]